MSRVLNFFQLLLSSGDGRDPTSPQLLSAILNTHLLSRLPSPTNLQLKIDFRPSDPKVDDVSRWPLQSAPDVWRCADVL